MKTIAAVLREINKELQIEELEIPELKPGQVLVKIAYSGVCHSQLNEIKGLKGEDRFLPHTFGHEGSGVIEAVGEGVKKVKPGDHVVLTWIKGNGADIPATLYKRKDGSFVNSGTISTFLTLAVISENRVVKIPETIPLREAALFGCAIPTGAGMVFNTAKAVSGKSIAVFGIGGVGMGAILAAKFMAASAIIAVDLSDLKLETALKIGATHAINARKQDILPAIKEITAGQGLDYAIESAGKRETMEMAIASVRGHGGLCVIAGDLPSGERISIDPFDLIKGKQILGSWGGQTQPDRDILVYLEHFLSGKFNLGSILGPSFQLKDINSAFDLLRAGETGRIIIEG